MNESWFFPVNSLSISIFQQPEICENECVNFPEPEKVDVASSDEESEEKYCAFTDHSDGCRFYFVYGYDVLGKLYIRAQRTKDCPPVCTCINTVANQRHIITINYLCRSLRFFGSYLEWLELLCWLGYFSSYYGNSWLTFMIEQNMLGLKRKEWGEFWS